MKFIGCVCCAAWLELAVIGWAAPAAEPGDASVQSGRSALGNHWSYNWYDESTDGVRLIDIETDGRPSSTREESTSTAAGGGGSLETLIVIFGALILGTLAWILARAFLKAEESGVVANAQPGREIDITRIEHLPFRIERGKTDLLAEARRLSGLQLYGEAMIYLYSHQLLELDRLHVIQLSRGKTNRQYLREAGQQARVRDQLAASMLAFEEVFFGRHELDRDRFESCLAGVEQLAATGAAP
ncbi:MAG TPA: DUF4129 domain-containing protein [Pirellulales bacterium]|jgi:hypothetical protein|nr:DUF4129 domain-containing protein [Pirellulales bacterium]